VPSGEKSKYGFPEWTFGSAESLLIMNATTYTVRTDDQAQVYVNGQLLGSDAVTDTTVEREISWLDEDQTIEHKYLVYTHTVYEYAAEFELRVQTPEGQDYPIVQTGENAYQALIECDESLKEDNSDVAVLLAERYALFMSGNLSKKTMLRYCASGTPFYKKINDYDTRWFASSEAYKFMDVSADRFVPLNSDAFRCEVSFTFAQKNRKGTSRTYPTEYTLYVVRDDKKWKLYNIELTQPDS
jgi:hypothetical protein